MPVVIFCLTYVCVVLAVIAIDAEGRRRTAMRHADKALALADRNEQTARTALGGLAHQQALVLRHRMEALAYAALLARVGIAVEAAWTPPASGQAPRLDLTATVARPDEVRH